MKLCIAVATLYSKVYMQCIISFYSKTYVELPPQCIISFYSKVYTELPPQCIISFYSKIYTELPPQCIISVRSIQSCHHHQQFPNIVVSLFGKFPFLDICSSHHAKRKMTYVYLRKLSHN